MVVMEKHWLYRFPSAKQGSSVFHIVLGLLGPVCVSACGRGGVKSLFYLTSSVTEVTSSVADPVVSACSLFTSDREDVP